ncbi:ABC transporter ATP-binding protein [Saliphagus sp. GCM10025334]
MSTEERVTGTATTDPPSESRPLIGRVEDLHLHFDTNRGVVKALDGVSFDVYEGETLALVGETGCGKTITARSFMQLVPTPPGRYVSGRVLFRTTEDCAGCGGAGCEECFGEGKAFEDLLERSPGEMQQLRGKRISMVFQDPDTALNPSLRIFDQIAESILSHHGEEVMRAAGVASENVNAAMYYVLENQCSNERSVVKSLLSEIPPLRKHKKAIRAELRDRVVEILNDTNIPNPPEVIKKYPHELSGGMKQRVMIAMGLVSKPDLLICDEPTTALDVTIQSRVLDLMNDLKEKYNTSLIYITHDLTLVEDIADRVAVMYAGSIAEIGTVDQVYNNAMHPYTWGLLNSIPNEANLGQELRGIGGSIPDLTQPPTGCRFCTRCPEEMDHCSTTVPPIVEQEPGHRASCHLYPEEQHRVVREAYDPMEETDEH